MRLHIFTLNVFLLSLAVQVPAQSLHNPDTLKGLKEIPFIVKYDPADGLPEEMRPTILQTLKDRARDMLMHAGVPVIQASDETELTGKLRLVFSVSLKKPTDPGEAIYIQTKLYERVRLTRDPTNEIEVATWSNGTVHSPDVTPPRVVAMFDRQVDAFISAYRKMNPDEPQVERSPANPPAPDNKSANALQGMKDFDVTIGFPFIHFQDPRRQGVSKNFQSEEERQDFYQRAQNEAEKKFKDAGIPWRRFSQETWKAGRPYLYVEITLGEDKFTGIAINGRNEVHQRVRSVRGLQQDTYALTWKTVAREGAPITDEAVFRVLNALLDEFIKAYKEANPKLATVDQ